MKFQLDEFDEHEVKRIGIMDIKQEFEKLFNRQVDIVEKSAWTYCLLRTLSRRYTKSNVL